MTIIDNRRSAMRVSTVFSVDVSGKGGSFAVDVGCGGLRLVSREPLDERELEFRLHLPTDIEVVLKGTPVWQQQLSRNGKTMAGVTFLCGQEEEQAILRRWMESPTFN